ncbi:hypothetical protein ABIF44_007182 [Bradyrhizobium japonicum]|nr:hypothetical protein RN69_38400 [Bradyrhizobium japonicum]BAL13155.1 hypothetical protein BJ6T_79090 [Bradyrhizobium japonicum USDA 6]KMK00041.1 hypothetical protein CF64_05160 [Bradyrhizobium japonicum]MCS3537375.1 hypothetical protein [Bradyrhizobium japonicum]MCS3986538.1 hypothetical protein [Bradyrhizobium japonicum]
MANVIADRHTAFYLARFAAEVIKIAPVRSHYHAGFNVVIAMFNMPESSRRSLTSPRQEA